MIKRSDVVSRGAVVALPALDTSWLGAGDASVVLIVGLAIVAVVALMVAAAAYSGDPRHKRRSTEDDSELFTTTPLPMPKEELAQMRKEARHHAFVPFRLPAWFQLGSVVIALGITYIVANRLRAPATPKDADSASSASARSGGDGSQPDDDSPESLDLHPAASIPFSFRVREFVAMDTGCAGHLEVTRGADSALILTARVHDDRGQLIDSARMPVQSLREGQVVEFHFPRASCERIGAWDVSGENRTR